MSDIKKYQHVSVVVDAVVLTKENAQEVAAWCGGDVIEEQNPVDPEDVYVGINYPTSDGNKRLSQGHVLYRSSNGKFHQTPPAAFDPYFEEIKPTRPVALPQDKIPGARQI